MKKIIRKTRLLPLMFSFFIIASSSAAPIDKIKALKIAQEFYQKQFGLRSMETIDLKLDYTCTDHTDANFRSTAYSTNLYYVFNRDKERGFVIVSADDKAGDVLAYSTTGKFSHSEMPENLKSWMESYKNAIRAIINNEIEIGITHSRRSNTHQYPAKVPPLLEKEGIKWHQRPPFNDDCPIDTRTNKNSVTGCISTAMSQVMRYHKHPQKGTGKKTYTTKTLKIKQEIDFNTSYYDWQNMIPNYNGEYNNTQGKAVAKLLHHTGVSIEMDYTSAGSAAPTKNVKKALVEHFFYENSIELLKRELYKQDEWHYLIKKELNEKRPVVYVGYNKSVGHAFVCDGYDTNDLFHINWGGFGRFDGYFDLKILEPTKKGTVGYSARQEILIGIQPKTEHTQPDTNDMLSFNKLTLPSPLKIEKSNRFNIEIKDLRNRSGVDYNNGALRLVLESEDLNYYTLKEDTELSLKDEHLYTSYPLKAAKLPLNTPNGFYKLRLQLKELNSENYITLKAKDESFRDITVEVNDTHLEFKYKRLAAKLELVGDIIIEPGELYQNEIGRFTFKLKNSGNAAFLSKLAIALTPKDGGKATIVENNSLTIEAGETRELVFKSRISLEPGVYTLGIWYSSPNNEHGNLNTYINGSSKELTIKPSSETKRLELASINYNQTTAKGDKLNVTIQLKNKGGFYSDEIKMSFLKYNTNEEIYKNIHYEKRDIILAPNEEKTYSFELDTKSLEVGEGYLMAVYYTVGEKSVELNKGKNYRFRITSSTRTILSCTPQSIDEIVITNEALSVELPIINSGTKYDNKVIRIEYLDREYKVKTVVEKYCTIDEKIMLTLEDNDETRKLLPGTYSINMLYKNKDDAFIAMDGKYTYLQIIIGDPELYIDKNNDNTAPDKLEFRLGTEFKYDLAISNKGGAFNEEIYLDIVPSEKLSKQGQNAVMIAANLKVARAGVGTANFIGSLEESEYKAGSYTVQVKQKKKTKSISRSRQEKFINIGDPVNLKILNSDGTVGIYKNGVSESKSLIAYQTNSGLYIELPKNSQTLYIFDMMGQVVDKKDVRNQHSTMMYDSSKMTNNIYLLVVEGLFGKKISKVYINKASKKEFI